MSQPYERLLNALNAYTSLLVAFSGGVDSSLLVFTAVRALGRDRVLAVTAHSPAHPAHEGREADAFCRLYDIRHHVVPSDMIRIINDRGNPSDRCYYCKHALFSVLTELARAQGYAAVAEGSTLDDDRDYRPGRRALAELGIVSPLRSAGLGKSAIRDMSRQLGLPSWDKPSCACLVSRFPCRTPITEEDLSRVDRAEAFIRSLGFRQCRVRHFGESALLEVEAERVPEALRLAEEIRIFLGGLGYSAVEIDPAGYRMGSMNEG